MGWDVPFVGHQAMGSGEVGQLLQKPEYWENVFNMGFKNCSFGPDGKLPPRTQAFVDSAKGKVSLENTSLWWIVSAVDAIQLIAKAVEVSRRLLARGDHRLLEHAEQLSRPVRRLHLLADPAQRLPD